jgi:hypothetical protein
MRRGVVYVWWYLLLNRCLAKAIKRCSIHACLVCITGETWSGSVARRLRVSFVRQCLRLSGGLVLGVYAVGQAVGQGSLDVAVCQLGVGCLEGLGVGAKGDGV